jgi:DNA-binding response OmpR family regulator
VILFDMSRLAILFVENHSVFAETVVEAFLSSHAVSVVPSIAAAREAMARSRYDVALVDYDLDDGKGDELVAGLRADGVRLRVIGVSSHAAGNDALHRAGADATCSKLTSRTSKRRSRGSRPASRSLADERS